MAINAYYHVTVAGAGNNSGDSWANAMADSDFETHIEGSSVAGDVYFLKDGTYDFTGGDVDFNLRDATAVSPIAIIGVKAGTTNEGANIVYSDWSISAADRPFFDLGVNQIRTGDYCILRNLDLEGGGASTLNKGIGGYTENCKIYNDSGTAGRDAVYNGVGSGIFNCEVEAETGNGIQTFSAPVLFTYIHDCDGAGYSAIVVYGAHVKMCFNILDNCSFGVNSTSDDHCLALNNTFYETDVGVSETDAIHWACINNVMEGNDTDGFVWTTQTDANFFWKNHGDDTRCNDMWDGVDTTTVFQDYEVTTGDPVFDTPGSDHAIGAASPCYGTGMSIELGVT